MFGSMVFIFQDGHLVHLLGASSTDHLDPLLPTLMICVAFGVSMDYELLLLSRIREAYLRTGDNRSAVAFGLGRAGRLMTTAALALMVPLAALATSTLTVLKLLGTGLAITLVVDATVVRCLLVPATIVIAGHWNWWQPSRPPSAQSETPWTTP